MINVQNQNQHLNQVFKVKSVQKYLYYSVLLLTFGCKNNSAECNRVEKNEVDNMLNCEKVIKDTLIVTFSNNPHNFENKDYISFSINNKKSILQKFTDRIIIDKSEIADSSNINIKVNRYIENSDKAFCFSSYQNKETVLWLAKFKYLYVSFSPSNDNTDEVQFYFSDMPAHN